MCKGQESRVSSRPPSPKRSPPTRGRNPEKTGQGQPSQDAQFNGRQDVSFSDPNLTSGSGGRNHPSTQVTRIGPSLSHVDYRRRDAFCTGCASLSCAFDRRVSAIVVGIHLEDQPHFGVDGYAGAHPLADARPRLGRIPAVRDAAEANHSIGFGPRTSWSNRFHQARVAAAVCNPRSTIPPPTAFAARGRLTPAQPEHAPGRQHLPLPRHPNPIWDQLAIDDLSASFIWMDTTSICFALQALVRARIERTILVSDASPCRSRRHARRMGRASQQVIAGQDAYPAGSNRPLEALPQQPDPGDRRLRCRSLRHHEPPSPRLLRKRGPHRRGTGSQPGDLRKEQAAKNPSR